jgi:hypothetical protein
MVPGREEIRQRNFLHSGRRRIVSDKPTDQELSNSAPAEFFEHVVERDCADNSSGGIPVAATTALKIIQYSLLRRCRLA